MFASLRQMFFNENTTPDIAPYRFSDITPDRIALLYYDNGNEFGFIATRTELTEVSGTNLNDTVQKMYRAAPDAKVVYIYSSMHTLNCIDTAISALKEIGYANIKVIYSWRYTYMVYQCGNELEIGECIAIVFHCPESLLPQSYEVFERTYEGYKRIGNENSCDGLYFRYCPMLKYIYIQNDRDLESELIIKLKYSCQIVYFRDTTTRYWLRQMWNEYDGTAQTFLPALQELKIEFKYGNIFHIETFNNSQLPFEKVFELDIEDVCKLEVNYFNDDGSSKKLMPDYLFPIGKSRVLKIVLKVGLEFNPQIDVTVASETDTVEGVVYAIGYKHVSKKFTGTLITSDRAVVVVERNNDISDVFKQLEAKKGSMKLRGVFVDYPGHVAFPLDVHRAVVNALPSPKTKVCISGIHTEWAMHLRDSCKPKVGEYVVIADVKREYPEPTDYIGTRQSAKDVCFLKTKEGFKIVDEVVHYLPDSQFETVVFIVKEEKWNYEKLVAAFPFKNAIFSESAEFPTKIRHLFAWEYFTGKNFDAYMVEPYRGISFVVKSGSNQYNIYRCWDSHYGSSECYIICAIDECVDSDSKFTVEMECVGYSEKCTVLEIPSPKGGYVLLHICVDEHLVPTVTVTETWLTLLPEGLATSDETVIQKIKSALENYNFPSYSNLTPMNASNVTTAEHTDNHEDNELKKVSKGLSETSDLPDISKVEAIKAESAADIEAAPTSEATILDGPLPVSDVSNATPHAVVLTFTHCNQVMISAGPDYTGDDEFPAYLRLRHKNECYEFVVGEKAKLALNTHRQTVIYDVPGLLAAKLNPKRENPTWAFDTSRDDNGSLLIHLNSKDKISPIIVFGHILKATLEYVNDHLPTQLERVGICLPSEAEISEKDLFAISSKLEIELKLVK